MDRLILIPARSGSTRVKNKNIKLLGEKPLVSYAITSAVQSETGRVVVSTNSKDIAEICRGFGAEVPFYRPDEFSDAKASSLWVIIHALKWFEENENWRPEIVIFCPPTNPFIEPDTIRAMCDILNDRKDVNSIVTIMQPYTHPFRIVRIGKDCRLQNDFIKIEDKTTNDIERTQDWPEVWEGSPACRMTQSSFFYNMLQNCKDIKELDYGKTYDVSNSLGYEIDNFEGFDIDNDFDWLIAEQILESNLLRRG